MFSKGIIVLGAFLLFLVLPPETHATPIDLSAFSVIENEPGSVTQSAGTISFAENYTDAALYFANDAFFIPNNVSTLSFDYSFTPGLSDIGDYLQFNRNYVESWYVDTPGSGHVSLDMTSFQGQTISIDWALIWGGDDNVGSTGRISNIDLDAAPVPEPTTLLLIGSGLIGLIGLKRKGVTA